MLAPNNGCTLILHSHIQPEFEERKDPLSGSVQYRLQRFHTGRMLEKALELLFTREPRKALVSPCQRADLQPGVIDIDSYHSCFGVGWTAMAAYYWCVYYGLMGNKCLAYGRPAPCYFINHGIKYGIINFITMFVTCCIRHNYKKLL
jgi:hypothetical protein